MINKDEIIELNIEKLAYGGEGLGRINDFTVFVPDTAPGDTIKAQIVSVKKNFAKAILTEIISPSKNRVKPFCPLANACGGCQQQHISYEEQLNTKKLIIEECMHKIAGTDVPVRAVIGSEELTEYRCKIQYPVRQTKNSKRFLAGYYKKNTHEIVNIKYCPIQPRIVDEITAFLRDKAKELKLTAYNETRKKGLLRHFVFRYSRTNKNLILTVVVNSEKIYPGLKQLCLLTKKQFPDIAGVLVNFNTKHSNFIIGNQTELISGQNYIEETLDGKTFKISADSFFQVNPTAAEKMFFEVRRIVEDLSLKNINVLDVYSGSGALSFCISDSAKSITAVEENTSSVNDGKENLKINKINNISFINAKAEETLQKLAENGEKFDLIILDPPRKGCSGSVIDSVKKLAATYIIYVSCNPSTLARDVKLLSEDYTPDFIQPVDMFCRTYHIESIMLLKHT